MWNFQNPAVNNCATLFVGAATCFGPGHPMSSGENSSSFCDGFSLQGYNNNAIGLYADANIDAWFLQSIIRPSTVSTVAGFSGTYQILGSTEKDLVTSVQAISGRVLNIPQRSNRLTFGCSVKNIKVLNAPRGYVSVVNPTSLMVSDIQGEGIFTDGTINAGNTECGVLIGKASGSGINGYISNVDGLYVTGTNYDSTVGICNSIGDGALSAITAHNVTGKLNNSYRKHFLEYTTQSTYSGGLPQVETQALWKNFYNGRMAISGSTYNIFSAGPTSRLYDNEGGSGLIEKFYSGRIPRSGNSETVCGIMVTGLEGDGFGGQYSQGRIRIFARRLDTGAQDYGEYLITHGQSNGGTTASGISASGQPVLTVALSVFYGPGTVITVGGNNYVVITKLGNELTLGRNLLTTVNSGDAVGHLYTIDATIRALSAGIINFSANVDSNRFDITNLLGAGITVEFRIVCEGFGIVAP